MKLTLPKNNLTKPKSGEHNIEQLCVIENTKENKKAIRHINKLAKEQGSRYKIKSKFRCPIDRSKATEYGSVKSENAKGIGLYIKLTDEAIEQDRMRQKRNEAYNQIEPPISEDHKTVLNKLALVYDENQNLIKENNRLKKLLKFQTLTFEQKAIYIIEKEIGKWQDNGWDENYFFNDVDQECVSIEINTILNNLKNDYGMK